MPKVLKKKLPPPRVRFEPPTPEEAVSAAQGLSEDLAAQVEIAAGLMGVAEEQIRPLVLQRFSRPIAVVTGGRRPVVVERRVARVVLRPRVARAAT